MANDLQQHLDGEVSGILGKTVAVYHRGKILHTGEVIGNTISGIKVGLLTTTLPNITKKQGAKYISIFYARHKQLKVI